MADGSRILTLALACLLTTVGFAAAASAQGPLERIGDVGPGDDSDCTDHPPIEVTEDEGTRGFVLTDTPLAPLHRPGSGVVAGTGTAQDPYVIEGWCIQPYTGSETGIRIANTDSHVIVRDNRVTDDFDEGLSVENAANVTVEDNHVENNGHGLAIDGSHAVHVEGNLLDRNGERFDGIGVTVTGSTGIDLVLNRIADNAQHGVETENSDALTIRGNLIVGHDFDGLVVDDAIDVEIRENTITSNDFDGLAIDDATNVEVLDNTIERNDVGVSLRQSGPVLVRENRISDNPDAGVRLFQTDGVDVALNNVTANGDGVELEQASDTVVTQNSIHANDVGLDVDDASGLVDARGNWWGDASGPSGGVQDACVDAVADGQGDPITTDGTGVCFAPWLSDPNPDVGPDE